MEAESLRSLGEWTTAESRLNAAKAKANSSLVAQHPLKAHVCERLGWLFMDCWKVAEAQELFGQAIEIRRKILESGDFNADVRVSE